MALTPLDFPASPTDGQTYPNPPVTGQPTYQWDAATGVWLSKFALGEEYVQLDGGQPMTGLLTLSGNPTAPMHAATKSYVDSTEKGRKNYIINGAMQISQENGATSGTVSGYYPVDQFRLLSSTTGYFIYQNATVTPSGSPYRFAVGITTPDAAVAAGDYVTIAQAIEGQRVVDLQWGTAAGKTVTLQFGVRGPAGTYCVSFQNALGNANYVAEYTIAVGEANIDVVKSVTIPPPPVSTWNKDNTTGISINWTLMVGNTYQQAAGAWNGAVSYAMGSPSQFNFMGVAAGNQFHLFDVSLTEGSVAPPFQVPDYASELALCQRYFVKLTFETLGWAVAANIVSGVYQIRPPMRSTPTLTNQSFSAASGAAGVIATASTSSTVFPVYNSSANWTVSSQIYLNGNLSARL